MKPLRTFPRPEPRRSGNAFILVAMLLSLCILSFMKDRYCSSPYVKSHRSQEIEAPLDVVKMLTTKGQNSVFQVDEDDDDGISKEIVGRTAMTDKPLCLNTTKRSTVCDATGGAAGDVRIQASSQTVFLHPSLTQQEWTMKPYARNHDAYAMKNIKEWYFKPFAAGDEAAVPPMSCSHNHSIPALIFSIGGFTGNLFHDFTDVLVPLFISAYQFHGEVQLIVADIKPWWVSKFALILKQFSNYDIIDASAEGGDVVRCFPRVIAGLSFHKELGVDPPKTPGNYSIIEFKELLRKAYGLDRAEAKPSGDDEWDIRRKPRLLIICRKKTRVFLNERSMVDMAMSLGFDVRMGEPEITNDLGKFARLVNSADVMLGVHGAGLTNMVFLPAGAVLIQVVPMGGLGWLAKDTFGDPSPDMKIKYMDYKIQADESTLSEQYSKDDPVIRDPFSIHKQGWNAISKTYLENQNARPHLGRLRNTLLEALGYLPHGQKSTATTTTT